MEPTSHLSCVTTIPFIKGTHCKTSKQPLTTWTHCSSHSLRRLKIFTLLYFIYFLQHPQQHLWPQQQQQPQHKVTFRSASHHDIIDDNEYEVPFGHLMPKRVIHGSSLSSMNNLVPTPDHSHFSNTTNTPFLHQYMQPSIQHQRTSSSTMRPQFYHLDT